MKSTLKLTRSFFMVILAVVLSATIGGQALAAASEPDEIRLGYWESPNEELLVKQTGALEAKYPNTKITWVEFQAGTDILAAIQGRAIDVATIGTPPGSLGIANGLPYKIFYVHDIIYESEGLVVKETSGIDSVDDLPGKKIATVFSSTSHFSLSNALKFAGVKETDLILYNMPAPDIYAAWERGDIEGAYVWEPMKSKLLEAGGKQIVSSGQVAEQGALTGEFGIVSDSFYEAHPDVVAAYVELLDAASYAYREDQANTAKLISVGLGLGLPETVKAMNEIKVLSKSDQIKPDYIGTSSAPGNLARLLKETADFLVEQKNLKSSPELSVFQQAILTELYD
ncbi:MAG: ABC transporter substrate-binding protein [Synergistaceae bacterium]|nr:ABC transporter substrate-binding protein [Synergistaceae bacterium]